MPRALAPPEQKTKQDATLATMFIDNAIAQKIVDRAIKLAGVNINVMDNDGIIIGSGDPLRIGQAHDGARRVLASGKRIELDVAEAAQLNGARCGVNLPVVSEGQIVGVVGITGDPESVRRYADLVTMTAELLVEQAALTAHVQWNQRQRENVLLRLIEGGPFDSLFAERLDRMKLAADLARVVIVADWGRETGATTGKAERHQGVLQAVAPLCELELIVPVSANRIAFLHRFDPAGGERGREQLRRALESRFRDFLERQKYAVNLVAGEYFPGLEGMARSYRSAVQAIDLMPSPSDTCRVSLASDFALEVLLREAEGGWSSHYLVSRLDRLAAQDRQGTLQKTLVTYFTLNRDFGLTAQRLYVHRNTLRYRLDRIADVLQLDFSLMEDQFALFVALKARFGLRSEGEAPRLSALCGSTKFDC